MNGGDVRAVRLLPVQLGQRRQANVLCGGARVRRRQLLISDAHDDRFYVGLGAV